MSVFYVDELRPLTGMDDSVFDYVMMNGDGMKFVQMLEDMLRFLLPRYAAEGKTSLVIAIGCTGGKHRSISVAREVYRRICEIGGFGYRLEHRDADRDRPGRGK